MPDLRNPHAVALSALSGGKGGAARAAKLSPLRRREIAQKAARARWGTSPEISHAQMLAEYRAELAESERQLLLLQRKVRALIKMVAGLEVLEDMGPLKPLEYWRDG
jgi:hypothetical protein